MSVAETPHRHFEKGGKSPEKEELFNLVITFTLLHPIHMCKCNINIKKDTKA